MCNWSLLSDGILNNIFVNLEIDDMYRPKYLHVTQCALTCRDWRIAAQSIVFSSIRLDSIEQMNGIQRLASSNKMIGNWVKCLDISFVVKNVNILLTIDSLFPKLEELNLFHSLPLIYAFFNKMLIERNKFRNLKVLPCPSIGQKDDLYLQCLDHIKNRTTRIDLWEDDYQNRDSYFALQGKLNQFRSLEVIVLNACNKVKLQSVTGYLDSLVNCSPASLRQIILNVLESERLFFSPTIEQNTIQPVNNLRKLFLEVNSSRYVFVPDDQFLVYLIKRFPKLHQFFFTIKTYDEYNEDMNFSPYYFPFYRRIPVQSVEAIQQLLVHLCNIPACAIENIIISNKNTSRIIHHLYTAAVDAISVPVSSHCLQIRYGVSKVGSFEDRNSINAYINFQLEYLKTQTIKIIFYRKDTTCHKQQFELIKEVENFFDTMCLQASTNSGFAFILNHVARYCPNVTNLAISKEVLLFNPFESQGKVLIEGIGVTRLIIKEFAPSLEQFPYITLCFPHLKTLVLHDCFKQFAQNEGSFFSIRMPDSSFTALKVVMSQQNISFDPIFIKVTTELSEPRYCFFDFAKPNPIRSYIPQYNDDKYKPTEIGYKNSIRDKGVVTCHIHCKSVEKFTIEREKSPLGFIIESEVLISI